MSFSFRVGTVGITADMTTADAARDGAIDAAGAAREAGVFAIEQARAIFHGHGCDVDGGDDAREATAWHWYTVGMAAIAAGTAIEDAACGPNGDVVPRGDRDAWYGYVTPAKPAGPIASYLWREWSPEIRDA